VNLRYLFVIYMLISISTACADISQDLCDLLMLSNDKSFRENVNRFVNDTDDQDELFMVLKSKIINNEEPFFIEQGRSKIGNYINVLAILAIIGRDGVEEKANVFMVDICSQPGIIFDQFGIINTGEVVGHIINILSAFGELGNESAIRCLTNATYVDYWRFTAILHNNQSWSQADIDDLMTIAVGNLYFLQSKHPLAKLRIDEIRDSTPFNRSEIRIQALVHNYDNGGIPVQALQYLGIRESFSPPFYRHPAVDFIIQSSCSSWLHYK